MSLDPSYITAPSLQMYFVDKDTGAPLSGGKVFFYRDVDKMTPKDVYEIQGTGPDYTYVPLPNPVILSAVGTFADNNGNDIVPYYYPYTATGEQDLYYIVVQNYLGVPQFVRPAWPNPNKGTSSSGSTLINYIPNGQFLAHTNLPSNMLVAGSNIIAQGGMSIELDSGATSTNTLTFVQEQYTQDPPSSPRYVANLVCSANIPSEQLKNFRIKFNDVNKFTDTGAYIFAIWLQSTTAINVVINTYFYFGTGGSASAPAPGDNPQVITVSPEGKLFNVAIDFGSNAGKVIGTNNDDYVAIDVAFPRNLNIDVLFSDVVLIPFTETPLEAFPTQTNADMITRGIFGWADLPAVDGTDIGLSPILTNYGMTWGISEKYEMTTFISSGTFTTPADSTTSTIYRARLVGGGGGGGGANAAAAAGGGGGAGAYMEGTFTGVSPSTAITITIGGPGSGGTGAGGTGGTGGTTTIGAPISVSCIGGSGGVGSTFLGALGGVGGTITGSLTNGYSIVGQRGFNGLGVTSGTTLGGTGGSTPTGFGGVGAAPGVFAGSAATGYGGGGGGSISSVSTPGGIGFAGLVIIERMTR